MKIGLGIGHCISQQGARNITHNITEFELNKNLCQDISEKITDHEVVLIYRDTYVDLPEKINLTNCDLYIEFHCNASENSKASGSEVLYYQWSPKGESYANTFIKTIIESVGLPGRGIIGCNKNDRGGYVLANTKMPAIILEPFFIDNDSDYETFINNRDTYINNISNTINSLVKL